MTYGDPGLQVCDKFNSLSRKDAIRGMKILIKATWTVKSHKSSTQLECNDEPCHLGHFGALRKAMHINGLCHSRRCLSFHWGGVMAEGGVVH